MTASIGSSSPSQGQRVFCFDAVRGLSALAVCAGHLRAVVFCDRAEIVVQSLWQAPFYFMTGLGHQAVMVFFVLSGYFVGGSVLKQRHTFRWSAYAVARLSRLWTVLVPALVFTVVVDAAVKSMDHAALAGGYQGLWNSGPQSGSYDASVLTLVANITFLQTIAAPAFGSNSPLWSLANEFWYYLLFPLAMATVSPRLRPASLAYCAGVACLVWWLPMGMLAMGTIWLFGVCVWRFECRKASSEAWGTLAAVAAGAIFAVSLAATKWAAAGATSAIWMDISVGATFALFASMLRTIRPVGPTIVQRLVSALSDVSYSLYLFHFPLVVAAGALVMRGRQLQPSAVGLLVYSLLLAAILAVCSALWFAFERNTHVVRKAMESLLGMGTRRTYQAPSLAGGQVRS